MSKIPKRFIGIITIIIIIPIIVYFVMNSSTIYLHKKLDFWCIFMPSRTYYYDAIDHGKDYNSLHIFSLSQLDTNRLSDFAYGNEFWKTLPVEQDILHSDISDVSFDSNMNDMLSCQAGYWYIDIIHHDFYVLDIKENKLYIRTASIIQ